MNEKPKQKKTSGVNFAQVCKDIRQNSNFTREQMAKYLGVTIRTYDRYEIGKIKPGAEVAFRLAGLYLAFVHNPAKFSK